MKGERQNQAQEIFSSVHPQCFKKTSFSIFVFKYGRVLVQVSCQIWQIETNKNRQNSNTKKIFSLQIGTSFGKS